VSERLPGPAAPVKLVTSKVAHHSYPYKTTDRAQFDRALDAARVAGAEDALLLTPGGFVAETAIWSVLWWEDQQLCAPAYDLGILPGVGRARLTELAGLVEERHSAPRDLARCSIFLVNAVRGVVAVASLDGTPVPPSSRTEALARQFWP
jgi:branched-subunit amino acid aminotransferase/4-amino-4-deoxychorismate lyase